MRLIANISSKILAFDYENVYVECLIDKESGQYEERTFQIDLFEDCKLKIGHLFKIEIYKVDKNKQMISIVYDAMVDENDFPKINFAEEFKDLKLN